MNGNVYRRNLFSLSQSATDFVELRATTRKGEAPSMRERSPYLCVLMLAGGTFFGQTADRTQFEVASVRLAIPTANGPITMRGGPGTDDPERISYQRVTLASVFMLAYEVKADQISGPGWMESERYDIEANVPRGTTKAQLHLMLQNLLADRFRLALHHDTKDVSMYELIVVKDGPRMKPSVVDSDFTTLAEGTPLRGGKVDNDGFPELLPGQRKAGRFGNGVIHSAYRLFTMADFAIELESLVNMATGDLVNSPVHVVENTGLTGKFDFKLEFAGNIVFPGRVTTDALNDSGSDSPTLFAALEKQLGLKLQKKKQQLDLLVIDHVERIPTEN